MWIISEPNLLFLLQNVLLVLGFDVVAATGTIEAHVCKGKLRNQQSTTTQRLSSPAALFGARRK